mmetsp:Transcript_5509/g.16441  ORF Transcript_5509/g.16441 Transcript_5509/m.16441 type:complete len:83 (+) Transcript_5509:419-667(+)
MWQLLIYNVHLHECENLHRMLCTKTVLGHTVALYLRRNGPLEGKVSSDGMMNLATKDLRADSMTWMSLQRWGNSPCFRAETL